VVQSGWYRVGGTEWVVQSGWYRVGGTEYRVGRVQSGSGRRKRQYTVGGREW
jgi:hypothetical protein